MSKEEQEMMSGASGSDEEVGSGMESFSEGEDELKKN